MAKTLARGTKLQVESAVPGTYTDIGNITSLDVPSPTKGEVDATDFDSVAAEALGTLPDNGELPFTGWYNKANAGQQVLLDDAHDPDSPERSFRVQLTRQDTQFTFLGWVKSFKISAPNAQGLYQFTGSIRVNGAVTEATIP